ncbi:hypothetical protein ACFV9E_36065 [Streptomyces sp. NPDC059835]|uniref:hypothetical protein n=1 Tax=Streptomyces sp. NPDC059835 TaxID=3346967 RepID=UPI003660E0D1
MGRRSVVIRLEPEADQPEAVAQPFDFTTEIHDRRGEILWALLTLIRAWTMLPPAQRPTRTVRLGTFSDYTTAVASILDHAGIPGAYTDRAEQIAALDDTLTDYRRFLGAVRELLGGGWLKASQITAHPVLQDLIPQAEGDDDRRIGHRALGRRILRPHVGRTCMGLRVEERWCAHTKAYLYRVICRSAERLASASRGVAAAMCRRATRWQSVSLPARNLSEVRREAADRRAQRLRVERAMRPGIDGPFPDYGAALAALARMTPARQ